MWMWLLGRLLRPQAPSIEPRENESDTSYAYQAALELERRLYENAVSGVNQVFAKESLIAAFLSSGAIIAYAACLQAYSSLISKVGQRTTWLVTAEFVVSLAVLVRSAFLVAKLFAGRDVQDLDDAKKFLDEEPIPRTRNEVDLALIVTYRDARESHEVLVNTRLKNLFVAMSWIGIATLLAFAAILGAFVSAAIHQPPISRTTAGAASAAGSDSHRAQVQGNTAPFSAYTNPVATTPSSSTQRPNPTPFPAPKGGTTMTKGGGGNGTHK